MKRAMIVLLLLATSGCTDLRGVAGAVFGALHACAVPAETFDLSAGQLGMSGVRVSRPVVVGRHNPRVR